MHHHRMSFYWDTNLGEYLFPGLNINGLQALILLSLVMIILTVIYEAIKVYQTQSRARTAREAQQTFKLSRPVSETANLIINEQQTSTITPTATTLPNNLNNNQKISAKILKIFTQAIIFLFQNTLGYVLMLSVMVYNGYLFIIVVLGLGLGYFLFGHISMRINMENIRARTTNQLCLPKSLNTASTSQQQQQQEQSNRSSTVGGYINEMITSSTSSSTSSVNDHHCNQSIITETSQLDKEIDLPSNLQHDNSNIIQSCRL